MDLAQLRPIALFAAAFLNLVFTFLIWLKTKSEEAYYLGWLAFFSAVYGLSWWAFFFFESNKLFWARATWVGVFIISANMIFVYCLTGRTGYFKTKVTFWYGLAALIFIVSMATPYVIPEVSSQYPFIMAQSAGPLNQLLRIFPIAGLIYALYYLILSHGESRGYRRLQIKYFITGLLTYLLGGLLFAGLLPFFFPERFFSYLDVPVYFSVIWLSLATYAIIKKELFDIKIILTELLVSLIGLILFVQIFLMKSRQEKIVELIIFLLFCFIAYLLIRATYREISKEREAENLALDLSYLNKNLEKKVREKTRQLRRSLEEIKDEQGKTLAIVANFTDPLIVLDKNNKISLVNPAAAKIFSLTKSDLGKKISTDNKFSVANFRTVIKKEFKINEIEGGESAALYAQEEIVVADRGQDFVYKIITAKILGADREILGTMKMFYDLTREKTIDRMKSEFISVAAHQLRTPLSAIKWVIRMILDGDAGQLNLEQQELLNKGYISNERIIRLVNDLLNVSRIEEGKFGFDFMKTDFNEVLDVSLANVEELVKKNRQKLIIKKPDSLPPVYLDKERMVMVMQNLLSNAIKYSPPKSRVEIIIEADEKNIEVKIIDHGAGIPEQDQSKLFTKFFRAANVIKMETEGTGLGLFIVKNIIAKHNGRVSVSSKEGRGTEVSFSLPLNQPVNS
ncbi:MAG: ATP-binding protein [bacterium]|nr:ATP-binding protein [bacterium]